MIHSKEIIQSQHGSVLYIVHMYTLKICHIFLLLFLCICFDNTVNKDGGDLGARNPSLTFILSHHPNWVFNNEILTS